ncbi:hypothetical protein FA15DRAFT_662382 [Coprinopsis marcescibilis]|uniref:GRAM domain-containing protein n=1 Tax=Coprinopsis marcescibilis TaxID=230819 RepID=A0A5C3LNY5_COPMA|nr:hypothetical protein FA15DRAFT_662382 [Coprinopsis marcescibilis]
MNPSNSNASITTTDDVSVLEYPDELEGYLNVDHLTYDELRRHYDDAEIRRFLHVFSSYVTEVKSLDGISPIEGQVHPIHQKDWDEGTSPADRTLSALIAETLVAPNLPATSNEAPPFALGRVRLTTYRLYLALQTTYSPFLDSLYKLAIWKNFQRSFVCCSFFWILWWHNMLFPAMVATTIAAILERKIRPYPRAQSLREYREQMSRAEHFGDRLMEEVSSPSPVGVAEVWRLARMANRTWNSGRKSRDGKGKDALNPPEKLSDPLSLSSPTEDMTSQKELQHGEDRDVDFLKQLLLHLATNLADLHERIHNIFLWRNPVASKRYTMALVAIFLFSVIIPTQYLVKLVWLVLGFTFWHITPVLHSLSSHDRWRLPPPFAEIPTDAEYAMHLISSRVAAGQDVLPSGSKPHRPHSGAVEIGQPIKTFSSKSGMNSIGKFIVNEAQRIGAKIPEAIERPAHPSHPLLAGALAFAFPTITSETYSYMGQLGSSPGLITLTSKRLYFTSPFSESVKREIDLDKISGVRKSGVLKGLQISYYDGTEHCELRFTWINNRDELFARLVGLGNRRWRSV